MRQLRSDGWQVRELPQQEEGIFVVASEVRKLAERSHTAAAEIRHPAWM